MSKSLSRRAFLKRIMGIVAVASLPIAQVAKKIEGATIYPEELKVSKYIGATFIEPSDEGGFLVPDHIAKKLIASIQDRSPIYGERKILALRGSNRRIDR